MQKATYLSLQLRESSPFLKDAGFKETAKLVVAAAEEIEALHAFIEQHLPSMESEAISANENIRLRRRARQS